MATLTLVVTRGGETRRFPLAQDHPMVVGRGNEVDILVPDVSISRQQFTLHPDPQGGFGGTFVELEVSAQSKNQVFLNGHPVTRCRVQPGDRVSVGYCSFEIHAEAELPKANIVDLPGDPAGEIDIRLAQEEKRIAPRWAAQAYDEEAERKQAKERADQAAKQKRSPLERMALPGAMLVLLGLLGFLYYRDQDAAVFQAPPRLDLFADPPPVSCGDADECFERAKRSYELGVKLSEQSGADTATLFKAARQFQVATIALRGQTYRLPELEGRYEKARKKVITTFEDARLRLIRAQQEGSPGAALAAIDEQLGMLQESKHPYRDMLLRARVKVREVKEQARKDALLGGGATAR